MKATYDFRGKISASKSILNRLLVLRSFAPGLSFVGESRAEDVVHMTSGLASLFRGESVHCGAAGTVLRFLALRASRIPGEHRLTGTRELFARPQEALAQILGQLGCAASFGTTELRIHSRGWAPPRNGAIALDRSQSSQFASGLLLNAWDLPEPLTLNLVGDGVSEGYLQMTLSLLRAAGMNLIPEGARLLVPARSRIAVSELCSEADASSAFAAAAFAVANAESAIFSGLPRRSLQPDSEFPLYLEKMGVEVLRRADTLRVDASRSPPLRPLRASLKNCPDLFPVLAVLCALAEGESLLHGAPHLALKESNRIQKTAELLRLMGVGFRVRADGIRIRGLGKTTRRRETKPFHPAQDHRLAMAAAVAKAAGFPIRILNREVVNKSFPEFWRLTAPGEGAMPCEP